MKRDSYLILLLAFLLVFSISVNGEITGEATHTFDANITVTSYFPYLRIISPENTTYTSNESILLNYTAANYETIWYNLDGSNNITITSPITFNTSEGAHTLYLYANNSFGNITHVNITFNVNTTALVEEPEEIVSTPTGGDKTILKDFSIDKEAIMLSLRQGEIKIEEIKIKNIGDSKLSLKISNPNLKDFIEISESSFELKQSESKTIVLNFRVGEDTFPNLYIGKLIINAGEIEKEILIAIEVESKESIIDVELKIPDKSKYVSAGEKVIADLEISNLRGLKPINVTVEYFLRNEEGETIISGEEVVEVETIKSLSKIFHISENFKPGDYVIYAKVTHKDSVSSDSDWFSVIGDFIFLSPAEKFQIFIFTYWYIILLIILISLLIIFFIWKRRKKENVRIYTKEIG